VIVVAVREDDSVDVFRVDPRRREALEQWLWPAAGPPDRLPAPLYVVVVPAFDPGVDEDDGVVVRGRWPHEEGQDGEGHLDVSVQRERERVLGTGQGPALDRTNFVHASWFPSEIKEVSSNGTDHSSNTIIILQ